MNFITSLLFGKVAAGLLWLLIPLCVYFYVNNTALEFRLNRCSSAQEALESQLAAKKVELDESRRVTEETINQIDALEQQYANTVRYYEALPTKQNTSVPVNDSDLDVIRGVRRKGEGDTGSVPAGEGSDTKAP